MATPRFVALSTRYPSQFYRNVAGMETSLSYSRWKKLSSWKPEIANDWSQRVPRRKTAFVRSSSKFSVWQRTGSPNWVTCIRFTASSCSWEQPNAILTICVCLKNSRIVKSLHSRKRSTWKNRIKLLIRMKMMGLNEKSRMKVPSCWGSMLKMDRTSQSRNSNFSSALTSRSRLAGQSTTGRI